MSVSKITFPAKDSQRLPAHLELPADGQPRAYALFVHCFSCGKNHTGMGHISRALTQAGFAVLRFDFTGLEENKEDLASPRRSSHVEDIIAAADFLEKEYQAASLLIGHSLGGTALLLASLHLKSAKAVVTIGAAVGPAHIRKLISNDTEQLSSTGKAEVSMGNHTFTIGQQMIQDMDKACQQHSFKKIRKALLIMHSPSDQVVSIDNAAVLYQQTLHPKSFVSLHQADHLLTGPGDALYVGSMVAAWVSRHIQTYTRSRLTSDKQIVTRTGKSFTTEIVADQHSLMADEPESVGGHDLGPDPYDLLAASLGACTGMTLRMYADHKKWPLKEVRVHLQHEKIYAQDCDHCENSEDKIDHIDRILELEGPLDDTQKKRLLEIADKCPVHKTLSSKTRIVTSLREDKS